MNDSIEQISGYIEKIREYKAAIKEAIIDKYKDINPDKDEINPGDDLSTYSTVIKEDLSLKFEENFNEIGYNGIPEELLLTLQGQTKYMSSSDIPANRNKNYQNKVMFVGANFVGDLDNNRRCMLLFTDNLKHYQAFNNLKALKEIYVLNDTSDLESLKESKINTYWFFRDTTQIEHIYAILDMEDYGYTLGTAAGGYPEGTYFFSTSIGNGNAATAATAPNLTTLYMKNIHRAYNFGNSPLSIESVLYCINNALYDAEYAEKGKTDDGKDGTYKFTLKSSAYSEEQIKVVIPNAILARATELGGNGLNMEIVFV